MSNLLREYVRQILCEARIKDVDLIPGQIFSALAEYATMQGLGGKFTFEDAMSDKLVSPYFDDLASKGVKNTKKHLDVMQTVYDDCVGLVRLSKADLGFAIKSVSPGNVGSTTAKVDVLVTGVDKQTGDLLSAEVHVKFNDFDRLIGLQADDAADKKIVLSPAKLAGKLDPNWPAAAQYKYLRNKFIVDPEGMGFKPKSPVEKIAAVTQYGAEKELQILQNPNLRRRFLDYLDVHGIPGMIQQEVRRFFASTGGAILFYKFGSRPKDIIIDSGYPNIYLHVNKMIGDPDLIEVSRIDAAEGASIAATYLYRVTYGGQEAFIVEARTSGTKHPMQLKAANSSVDFSSIMTEEEYFYE